MTFGYEFKNFFFSFDKNCSANTVYFGPHPDNCIKKILRILKPGGKLILAFEDKAQLESRPLNTNVFHIYHQDEIKKFLSRNGFSGSIDMLSRDEKMAFFEEVILTDSIKIKTTPEKIFSS